MDEAQIEKLAKGLTELEIDNGEGGRYRLTELLDFSGENQTRIVIKALAQAALAAHADWCKANGFAVVPVRASPKMAEAGLFANDDALLMAASCMDMMNAYAAMIAASDTRP